MIARNEGGQLLIIDTERRFNTPEELRGLTQDILDALDLAEADNMKLPRLRALLYLLQPTSLQVRAAFFAPRVGKMVVSPLLTTPVAPTDNEADKDEDIIDDLPY